MKRQKQHSEEQDKQAPERADEELAEQDLEGVSGGALGLTGSRDMDASSVVRPREKDTGKRIRK